MKGKTIILKTDGTTTEAEWDKPCGLDYLQAAVDGYIELVPHFNKYKGEECVVYCNEEGKMNDLPMNIIASDKWYEALGFYPGDILVGDVIILTGDSEFLQS
jgi:hypothetical protein